jgi:hypothetical protein
MGSSIRFRRSPVVLGMPTKNNPIAWDHDWARASEEFEDQYFGPHTKRELHDLITDAVIANDACRLERFYDPIKEVLFKIWHRDGSQKLAESEKRFPRNGPRKVSPQILQPTAERFGLITKRVDSKLVKKRICLLD